MYGVEKIVILYQVKRYYEAWEDILKRYSSNKKDWGMLEKIWKDRKKSPKIIYNLFTHHLHKFYIFSQSNICTYFSVISTAYIIDPF